MTGPSGDYHRGEMDVHEQASTYHAFLLMSKWGSLALAVVLVWAVICFCTGAGFLAAVISAFVVGVVGILVLREKPNAGH